MNRISKLLIPAVIVIGLAIPATANATEGRVWKVSYNAALSMHQAAVPLKFAHPGEWMKVSYHGKSVKVRAVSGSCTCYDISDEAMNKLASTSKGVIRASVTKL